MIELEATMIFLRSSGISLFPDWFSICWIWSVQYYESYTKSYIYTFWYNFDTVLYQFLETRTSDRTLISSQVSTYTPLYISFTVPLIYPLIYFLYSPFQLFSNYNFTNKEKLFIDDFHFSMFMCIQLLF